MSRNKAVLQGQLQHENMQKGNRTGKARGVFGHGQNSRGNAGFSLLEILAALAIMVILFAVGIVGVGELHRNLTQTKLDKTAEQIYIAAQNQMAELYAAGDTLKLDETAIPSIGSAPSDWDTTSFGAYTTGDLRYVTSLDLGTNATEKIAADALFPVTSIAQDVHDNNNWLIEYNPKNGYIYGVFYSESAISNISQLRIDTVQVRKNGRTGRINYSKAGNDPIGYYGGSTVVAGVLESVSYDFVTAQVEIENKEELNARIRVVIPAATTDKKVRVTVMGQSSSAIYERIYDDTNPSFIPTSGDVYDLDLPLDRLETGKHFADLNTMPGVVGSFIQGENITVKVTASCQQTRNGMTEELEASDEDEANSLYADYHAGEAEIAYGRHLQNLTDAGVGVVTSAVQIRPIDFAAPANAAIGEDALDSWKDTYGTQPFVAVNNPDVKSYNGNGNKLQNMNIAGNPSSGNAGLFATMGSAGASLTIQGVSMVNAKVNGSGNVGALAGQVNGATITVTDSRVYLDDTLTTWTGASPQDEQWITGGANVGGLIGSATGEVNIGTSGTGGSRSFVATVIAATSPTGKAGGFVGNSGKLTVNKAYADNYISGSQVGGFAASCGSGSEFQNCYVAGFAMDLGTVNATGISGFAPATGATVTNAYSALDVNTMARNMSGSNSYALVKTGTFTNAYSLSELSASMQHSGDEQKNDTQLRALSISGFVGKNEDTTFPYNIGPNNNLTEYPYPGLSMPHYGDWAVVSYTPAELVYYEKYNDGSYGFSSRYSAGNKLATQEELKHKSIVQDGYALLYRTYNEAGIADVTCKQDTIIRFYEADFAGNNNPVTADMSTGTYRLAGMNDADIAAAPTIHGNGAEVFILRVLPWAEVGNFAGLNNNKGAEHNKYYLPLTIQVNDTAGNPSEIHGYYFNPFFANGVAADKVKDPAAGADNSFSAPSTVSRVTIRTPRQLYLLSKYYPAFRNIMGNGVVMQEADINYAGSYEWAAVTDADSITAAYAAETHKTQDAIGYVLPDGTDYSFRGDYNGGYHKISGVSIVAGQNGDEHYYAGLFGSVTGAVRNLVFSNDYSSDNPYSITHGRAAQRNGEKSYMGALVAYNDGRITNCAVAGFKLIGRAYENSNIYVGGLAGANDGFIYNSSADTPYLEVQANGTSRAYTGAFTGDNSETISNSYALGAMAVRQFEGTTVMASGFCGNNSRTITDSYSATALTLEGVEGDTYGFANGSGVVNNCYYLDNGSYYYVSGIRAYSFADDHMTGTTGYTDSQMKAMMAEGPWKNSRTYGVVAEGYSYDCSATLRTSTRGEEGEDGEKDYPYPAVVKDAAGNYVHYGNWTYNSDLGEIGFLYWEHEVGGSNEGYHFYMVNNESSVAKINSTLCESHDDGGVVTEYGYGYYVSAKYASPKVFWGDNLPTGLTKNEVASNDLKEQFAFTGTIVDEATGEEHIGKVYNYNFYCFDTTGAFNASPETGKMYLKENASPRITVGAQSKTYNKQNAMAALQKEEGGAIYYFTFNPFFGAAVEPANLSGNGTFNANDMVKYQIRSIDQLQFVNWNSKTTNNTQLVMGKEGTYTYNRDTNNYREFPYLMYTSVTGTGGQLPTNVNNRTVRVWDQTHDVTLQGGKTYTPIAGAGTSSGRTSYDAMMYAWFGGEYNGNSYTINNVNITSNAFTVGLFGTTVGAKMQNVILYSDNNSTIRREDDIVNHTGAYSIGGLVGVAFDYIDSSGKLIKDPDHVITNCAIAGYIVQDLSKNQLGLGEANIGGLIGVANTDLKNCTAVCNIDLNPKYTKAARYGAYIRVGGVTGAVQSTATNCYSGGNITLGDNIKNWKENYSWPDNEYGQTHRFGIYLGGIAGSAFTSNYKNFTGATGERDGQPYFVNCYTFMNFPATPSAFVHTSDSGLQDNTPIMKKAYIGSIADRQANSKPGASFDNCYYLATGKNITDSDPVKQTFGATVSAEKPFEVTYDQMAIRDAGNANGLLNKLNRKGASFAPVTTTENGAPINGKYSFPGNDMELKGENYPFPTIITQKDLTFNRDVHVHYGQWPKNGLYTDLNAASLDLVAKPYTIGADGNVEESNAVTGVKDYMATAKLRLYTANATNTINPSNLVITYGDGKPSSGIVEALVSADGAGTDENGAYVALLIRGLRPGAEVINITYNGTHSTKINVTVAAQTDISAIRTEAVEGTEYDSTSPMQAGDTRSWVLNISDYHKFGITDNVKEWVVTVDNADAISNEFTVTKQQIGGNEVYVLTATALPVEERVDTLIRVQAKVEVQDKNNYELDAEGNRVVDESGKNVVYRVETRTQAIEVAVEPPQVSSITFHVMDINPNNNVGNVYPVLNMENYVKDPNTGESRYLTLAEFIGTLEGNDHVTVEGIKTATTTMINNATPRIFAGWYVAKANEPVDVTNVEAKVYASVEALANEEPIIGEMHAYAIWQCKPVQLMYGDENVGYAPIGMVYVSGNASDAKVYSDYNLVKAVTNVADVTSAEAAYSRVGYTFGRTVEKADAPDYVAGYEYTAQNGAKYAFTDLAKQIDSATAAMMLSDSRTILQAVSQWTPKQYLVVLHANYPTGATPTGSQWSGTHGTKQTYDAEWTSVDSTTGYGYSAPSCDANDQPAILLGWYTAANAGEQVLNEAAEPVANENYFAEKDGKTVWQYAGDETQPIHLYAHWQIGNMLTLDLNYDGSTPMRYVANKVNGKNKLSGENYIAPTREGYKALDGWFTEANGGVKVLNADGTVAQNVEGYTSGNVFAVTENKTLYAHWKGKKHTVHFSADGTKVDTLQAYDFDVHEGYPVQVGANGVPTQVSNRENANGLLDGWAASGTKLFDKDGNLVKGASGYTDASGNWIYDGDVTLTALWNFSKTFTLSAANANPSYSKSYTIETTAQAGNVLAGYTTPSRGRWMLDGWYDGNTKVVNANGTLAVGYEQITNGATYTAKWTRTITLSANKATNNKTQTINLVDNIAVNSTLPNYNAPTRTGWALDGWYTTNSGNGGTKVADDTGKLLVDIDTVNQDTLYAKWSRSGVYVQATTMENGKSYVIANSNAANGNNRYALTANSGKKAIDISTGGYDENGNVAAYITTQDLAAWTAGNPTGYGMSLKNGNNYLTDQRKRANNHTLTSSGNRQIAENYGCEWNYDGNRLICSFQYRNWGTLTRGNSYLRYSGNSFSLTENDTSGIYLYQQGGTVYDFD